jgi:hypothetical protein
VRAPRGAEAFEPSVAQWGASVRLEQTPDRGYAYVIELPRMAPAGTFSPAPSQDSNAADS